MRTGDRLITGQIMDSVAPVEECIRETVALPFPDEPVGGTDGDPLRLPGGAGRTADAHHIVRGIGYGVAMKNLMYSGILPGDQILSVNGVAASNLDLNSVNGFFNSKPGRRIRVELSRKGEKIRREFLLQDQI
jgi:hypothetical protein